MNVSSPARLATLRGGVAIVAVLSAAVIAWLYFWQLASSPVYLAHDEVLFAVQAQSIADRLRDVSGTFLPLYIHMGGNYWCSPEHVYATAALLKFVHISDGVIRVPSVVVGLIAAVLMYFVGRRVFRSAWYGVMTAVLLALTPAHFLASRFKVESHYPLPFIIGWLACLLKFRDTGKNAWLLGAGVVLGFGMYSYHASPIMMPLYVVMTVALVVLTSDHLADAVRPAALGVAAFAIVALPYAAFVLTHPEYARGEVNAYQVFDADHLSWWHGFREVMSWVGLTARSEVYYDYFNPSFLFFSGGSSLIEATQKAGVFLLPFAVFLPAGIYHLVKRENGPWAWLFLAGLVTAPLAAALVVEPYATRRILPMLPFATIIAAYGVKELVSSARRSWRVVGVTLLAAVPVCFGYFYADYLGEYRLRSAYWFENNIRGALETTIAESSRDNTPRRIYISSGINEYVEWYWKFYTVKHDRPDLTSRAIYFSPKSVTADVFAPNALIVAEAAIGDQLTALAPGQLTERGVVREPTGNISFRVWAKDPGAR